MVKSTVASPQRVQVLISVPTWWFTLVIPVLGGLMPCPRACEDTRHTVVHRFMQAEHPHTLNKFIRKNSGHENVKG